MALQGVPLEVHDIDLQTDRDGAYAIQNLLAENCICPLCYVQSERLRSYLGQFDVEGIKVDVMGDVEKRPGDTDAWEAPVIVTDHSHWIEFSEMRIPVMDLAFEQQAYLKMGRLERAELVQQWLQAHPDE